MMPLNQGLMILAQCDACGAEVWKRFIEYTTKQLHFCNAACYRSTLAARMSVLAQTRRPARVDSAVRERISRAGGLANARMHGNEQMRIRARLGYRALLALPEERRAQIAKLAAQRALMARWGLMPRGSVWYVISPRFVSREKR